MSSFASEHRRTRPEQAPLTPTKPGLPQLIRMWVTAVTGAGFQLDDALTVLNTVLPTARQTNGPSERMTLRAAMPAGGDFHGLSGTLRRRLSDDNHRVREQSRILCEIARELGEFFEEQDRMSVSQRTIAIRKRRRRLYTTEAEQLGERCNRQAAGDLP